MSSRTFQATNTRARLVEHQSDRSLRRKTMLRLSDATQLQEARRASIDTAEMVWKRLAAEEEHDNDGNAMESPLLVLPAKEEETYPVDGDFHPVSYYYSDDASSSSLMSKSSMVTEERLSRRATRRGTDRGLRERNEAAGATAGRISPTGDSCLTRASNFDLITVGSDKPSMLISRVASLTSTTANPSAFRNSRWKRMIRRIRGRRRVVQFTTFQTAPSVSINKNKNMLALQGSCGSAWMCGVCGMAFSNHALAETHERQHIADVVAGMEWTEKAATTPLHISTTSLAPPQSILAVDTGSQGR